MVHVHNCIFGQEYFDYRSRMNCQNRIQLYVDDLSLFQNVYSDLIPKLTPWNKFQEIQKWFVIRFLCLPVRRVRGASAEVRLLRAGHAVEGAAGAQPGLRKPHWALQGVRTLRDPEGPAWPQPDLLVHRPGLSAASAHQETRYRQWEDADSEVLAEVTVSLEWIDGCASYHLHFARLLRQDWGRRAAGVKRHFLLRICLHMRYSLTYLLETDHIIWNVWKEIMVSQEECGVGGPCHLHRIPAC